MSEADKRRDAAIKAANERPQTTDVAPALQLPVVLSTGSTGGPRGGRTRRRFKKHRVMSRKYCKKTPCRRMGFTQKASCRPYKNCYK